MISHERAVSRRADSGVSKAVLPRCIRCRALMRKNMRKKSLPGVFRLHHTYEPRPYTVHGTAVRTRATPRVRLYALLVALGIPTRPAPRRDRTDPGDNLIL